MRSDTAGGVVSGQIARADIDLDGGVRMKNLRVTVLPRLSGPLLGMDVLGKLRFTQSDGVMRLETSSGGWN
jgi:aspartyl protease family protein